MSDKTFDVKLYELELKSITGADEDEDEGKDEENNEGEEEEGWRRTPRRRSAAARGRSRAGAAPAAALRSVHRHFGACKQLLQPVKAQIGLKRLCQRFPAGTSLRQLTRLLKRIALRRNAEARGSAAGRA